MPETKQHPQQDRQAGRADQPPSGRQFEITAGRQRATIVQVGGGIREYSVDGRDVLQPYPAGLVCDAAHGTPLVPWPNRLADGRYDFDGRSHQVELTEPEKRNAIHGFLRWQPWHPVHQAGHEVVLGTTLFPREGYPFALDMTIRYTLGTDGLTCAITATNTGAGPCPYGCGQHPYLSPGDGLIDDCVLWFEAATRILTDAERQLPVGTEPVSGTEYDFSSGRKIGGLQIDHAFTDLARDEAGRARVRLTAPDGRTAELWADQRFGFLELYTADDLAAGRRRRGLGVEPMSCPPNAFGTGEHVIRLEPAESVTMTWGATLR
jgi:aldose 1-epimerase